MSYLYSAYPQEPLYFADQGAYDQVRSDSTDDDMQLDCYMPKVVKTNICKYKT